LRLVHVLTAGEVAAVDDLDVWPAAQILARAMISG
jgi:hypothetical protein